MNICIYGAANEEIAKVFFEEGEKLGREIARRGYSLVYGGGATGLMGAVSRGVHQENGFVTGIVPEFFTDEEVINKSCNVLLRPKTMRERKAMLEYLSDAFIITPGGMGTYDEFFEILTLKKLKQHSKPIAILNTDGCYNDLITAIKRSISDGFTSANTLKMCPAFEEVNDVMNYIDLQLKK